MVDTIINALCGAGIALVGASGYVFHILSKKDNENNTRYSELSGKYSRLVTQKVTIESDYAQLKKEFQQLADEHKELKETYAPLAALNPFERQAVGAVTNQSILDEWMNGEIKEGN